MRGHRLLLGFGVLSLGISLALTVLILATGVTLLTEHLHPGGRSIWPVLLFTCVIGGLSCVILSTLQFVQLGALRDAELNAAAREARWSEALLAWAYADVPLPGRLDEAGVQTLLKLRDSLSGEVADRLQGLYAAQGWLSRDLRVLAGRSVSVVARAQAIERLALLREPLALDALQRELRHWHPEIRALALLALSRSVGRLELPRSERISRVLALHGAIARGRFSVGQVQEALTLLGGAGRVLVHELLLGAPDSLRAATLDVLARQRTGTLDREVLTLLSSANAELRAGALRVLVSRTQVPAESAQTVLDLTEDLTAFVRLQATKAAAYLDPVPVGRLWALLGDPHWWVRRAAAQSLLQVPDGERLLSDAAGSHTDRYARDIARTALQEYGERQLKIPLNLPPVRPPLAYAAAGK
jgi:HEAT repeat protein